MEKEIKYNDDGTMRMGSLNSDFTFKTNSMEITLNNQQRDFIQATLIDILEMDVPISKTNQAIINQLLEKLAQ